MLGYFPLPFLFFPLFTTLAQGLEDTTALEDRGVVAAGVGSPIASHSADLPIRRNLRQEV